MASTPQPDSAEDSSLARASRTLAVASVVSRITGFLRSLALGAAFGIGAHSIADPYNGANSFPNIAYELLLGGLLSSVLIPLLVSAQDTEPDAGEALIQRLLSWSVLLLGLATAVAVIASPLIAALFVTDHDKRTLTSALAALLLPQLFFYGVGALMVAILNSRRIYAPAAWAPVANNIVVLATLGVFALMSHGTAPTVTSVGAAQVLVLGIGTTLGIAVQALTLVPALRRTGWRWRWRLGSIDVEGTTGSDLRRLAGWTFGYVLASQLGIAVITRIAFSHNGLSTFTYAVLLFQIPYGILAVSVLTALMPRLSQSASRGDLPQLKADLRFGARLSILGLTPVTAGLIALAPSFTSLVFLGRTSLPEARLVGSVLAVAAVGLVPYALITLQMRAFYAMRDARTPALINAGMAALEIAIVVTCSFVLHGDRVIESLAGSTVVSYFAGAVAGHFVLRARIGLLGFAGVLRLLVRVAVASSLPAITAYVLASIINDGVGGGRLGAAAALGGGVVVGLLGFSVWVALLRISEFGQLRQLLRR